MGKIRGTHSSPGYYTEIVDLQYAAKNFGVTTLGLVGETLKGPAFEAIPVKDWVEYVNYFGGTSAEKFKDTLYPKYELPYIAKSYLNASDQLYVVRVLGFSGYNAGRAFVVTATFDGKKYPVAVLRSRGGYNETQVDFDPCKPNPEYDVVKFRCDEVVIDCYKNVNSVINNCETTYSGECDNSNYNVNRLSKGRFTIVAKYKDQEVGRYPVSLNPSEKDYIYKVLGTNAIDGGAAVFVEELYDFMLDDLVAINGSGKIDDGAVTTYGQLDEGTVVPVEDFVTKNATASTVEKKYIYSASRKGDASGKYVKEGSDGRYSEENMTEGAIYVGRTYKQPGQDSATEYGYFSTGDVITETGGTKSVSALVRKYNRTFFMSNGVVSTSADFSNYHEQFRCAVTPWIVSELKGTGEGAQVKRLFRFYTISDGNCANEQIKVSIANIRPDEGTFDVLIRDFNDSDASPVILESFKGVNMVPGDRRYIGLRMGTADGSYAQKSKYVLVDLIDDEVTRECVPAGFLGYPVREYPQGIETPFFSYNKNYDEEIREKKQYFGLSDRNGVDIDMLTYKGRDAYSFDNTDNITSAYLTGFTSGFHLDARLSEEYLMALSGATITIDGNADTSGAKWETVGKENKGSNKNLIPVIGTEDEMKGTIYENVNLRKFTVYPYGGFDGWDIYRGSRTNGDEYKASLYKGVIGPSKTFSREIDSTTFSLPSNCITSDYYAYLAGAKQFENPEIYEINLLATPGIDYVNQGKLESDILDIVKNRLDCFYVVTTPDKPAGASYAVDDMYSSADAAENVEIAGVDTYYASTYYPWVRFFDKDNNIYINLPATKDVVRNMADVDNKRFPWVAPAGLERGVVEGKNLRYFPKLEDRDTVYDGRINSLIKFSKDGIRVWGNKTLYVCDDTNPMNRINTVRGLLYIRRIILESTRGLFFDPEDETLTDTFERIVRPILDQAETDRGLVDYRLTTSQTVEQRDMHEFSGKLFVKFTPDFEYLELSFVVTPLGVSFDDIA